MLGVLVIAGRQSLVRIIIGQRAETYAQASKPTHAKRAETLAALIGMFMITVGTLMLTGVIHRP